MKFIFCFFFLMSTALGAQTAFQEYFNYTPEELRPLAQLSSELSMSKAELRKWDAITTASATQNEVNFYERTRIFCYLYVAQMEAARLSYQLSREFTGSLDPISSKVCSFFFKEIPSPALYQSDPYSEALAELIFAKIKQRILQENNLKLEMTVPKRLQNDFSAGLMTAKWIPWCAKPSMAYWPPPPPASTDPVWKTQIAEIKQAQTPMTQEKRQAIYRWAGMAYPGSDDLRAIVDQFLICQDIPFQKSVQVRSTVMVGMYDSVIAFVGCKYHYLVIRPQAYDPSVMYIIPVPKHPSYPAGHSVESALVAAIMSFYFPSDAEFWHTMAKQCGLSRIWAGIHYPIDDQAGIECGTKVAHRVLDCMYSHSN